MTALPAPQFKPLGQGYEYTWPDLGVQVDFQRFHDSSREGLHAEILVSLITAGQGKRLLHAQRFSVLSGQAQTTIVRALQEQAEDIDWRPLITAACFLARQRWEEGEATVDLREVDPLDRPRWLLRPYLEHGGPTILFGSGASCKSYLALAAAVSIASGSPLLGTLEGERGAVMYLDWETDQYAHAERLRALCAGASSMDRPPVYYRHMVAPLADAAGAVHREVDRLSVAAVVVDSLGYATSGGLEKPDLLQPAFSSLRELRVPALIVSHVTHSVAEAMREPSRVGRLPTYGSIYAENSARNMWSVWRTGDESTPEQTLVLRHEKTNNGRYEPRHAIALNFQQRGDELLAVGLRRRELRDLPDLQEHLPLAQRILVVLAGGAMPINSLAEELGSSLRSVKNRLGDLRQQGRVIRLGRGTWGLAAPAPNPPPGDWQKPKPMEGFND